MDRIRSGEALRPSLVEWLSEHIAPVRLRPVFLAGAAGCALWIGVMMFHPFADNTSQLAGNHNGKAATPQIATSNSPSSSRPDASALGTGTAPSAPAGEVVASAPRVTPAPSRSAPGVQTASSADSARIDAPYQDEYILDQFYLNRSGEEGVHSIVPVSGRPTDDVYITF